MDKLDQLGFFTKLRQALGIKAWRKDTVERLMETFEFPIVISVLVAVVGVAAGFGYYIAPSIGAVARAGACSVMSCAPLDHADWVLIGPEPALWDEAWKALDDKSVSADVQRKMAPWSAQGRFPMWKDEKSKWIKSIDAKLSAMEHQKDLEAKSAESAKEFDLTLRMMRKLREGQPPKAALDQALAEQVKDLLALPATAINIKAKERLLWAKGLIEASVGVDPTRLEAISSLSPMRLIIGGKKGDWVGDAIREGEHFFHVLWAFVSMILLGISAKILWDLKAAMEKGFANHGAEIYLEWEKRLVSKSAKLGKLSEKKRL